MIRIRAMLEMFSKGTDKVKKDVSDINQQLDQAADNSERMARSQSMSSRDYRGARGITGARAAEGRNFSGIASLARQDTGGFVAAYATLAANIFAVTAAFQALSNAARTEQLTRGLELMGARGGTSLTVLANRFKEVTDNAISTADAMRSVAQATSAGIGADDIERLGNVARGASLALGRDMSDSIDRLTRGIVKVEPELLDELGIMVRLDEAVRDYAKANNLTASSLTNAQRRQAFMNAVLEEGERKFGAINDQIETNPYDKLASSVRDFGTEVLKVVNTAILPLIKLVTDVPVLGLVPALGVLSATFAKVLPTIDSFSAKSDRIIEVLQARRTGIGDLFFDTAGQLEITTDPKERLAATKELNRLNAIDQGIAQRISLEEKRRNLLVAYREDVKKRGIITATKELFFNQANLAVDQTRAGLVSKISLSEKLGLVGSVIGRGLGLAATALTGILTVITLITAAVALATAAFKFFFPPTEAEQKLKRYKEEMKDLLKTARETRNQLENLTPGESFDALVKNYVTINDKLRDQIKLEKEMEEQRKRTEEEARKRAFSTGYGTSLSGQLRSDETFINYANREDRKALQESILQLKEIDAGTASIAQNALNEGKSREEILAILEPTDKKFKNILDLNKNISEASKVIVEEWNSLRTKEFDTGLTKINDQIKDIDKTIKLLDSNLTNNLAKDTLIDAVSVENLRGLLSVTREFKLEIDDSSIYEINNFISNLQAKKELELKLKYEDLAADTKAFYEQQISMFENMLRSSVLKLFSTQAQLSAQAEKHLQDLRIQAKTLQIQTEINSTNLQINEKLLEIDRKREDAKKSILTFTTREDKLISNIENTVRSLQDIDIARQKTANDIAALEQASTELKLQKAAEEARDTPDETIIKEIDAQIIKNAKLKEEKKKLYETELQGAQESANILAESLLTESKIRDVMKGQNTALDDSIESQYIRLEAENRLLALKEESLSISKQEAELAAEIADKNLTLQRIRAEGIAARQGRGLTTGEERDFARRGLENQIKAIEKQEELLELEKGALLDKITLEQKILDLQLDTAELNLKKAIDEASPTTDVTSQKQSLAAIPGLRRDIEETLLKQAKIQESIFAGRAQSLSLDKQIAQESAANIPENFSSIIMGFIEELKNDIKGSFAAFGLSGRARETFLAERQTILQGSGTKAEKEEELKILKKQSFELQQQQTLAEGLNNVFNTVQESISGAFMSLVDGSKSAKQAFGDMARAILASIADMIIQMLVLKSIQAMGFTLPFANGGIMPASPPTPLANGGIMSRSSGLQGIVSQPTYLVGEGRYNEAVVPLPNGRAIPVQMHGNSGSTNNVQVNVNMTSSGTQTQTEGVDQAKLGQAVAAAVQRELVAQRAPGGLLNRYSAI